MTQLTKNRELSVTELDQDVAPVRILMVAANVDSRFGGVSAVLGPLSAAIQEDPRFHVSIAAFAEHDENIEPLERFAPVTRYPLRGLSGLYRGEPRTVSGGTLSQQIESSDLVHIHGLWQEHCASAAALARRFHKPYIISAHGMLDRWALSHKGWKKSVYLRLVERKNLVGSAALHALTSSEVSDYKKITTRNRVETIPNAVNIPLSADPKQFLSAYSKVGGKSIVLFLSRLHQKKGLDLLSAAWARIAPEFPNAHLVIAGPDFGNMQRELQSFFEARHLANAVTFTGMLSGSMKWSALAAADLFVLPSRSEGLSMAALEAMGMGKPVLLTEQCHIDGLVEQECGWQIQPDVGELETALRDFFRSPQRAQAMGRNGRRLVEAQHSWEIVGNSMRTFYGRLVRARVPLLQPI